ncbi:MAG: hypothetical protein JST68_05185 [Bacteroidetes bacterium]|nr:hypothetical protein [Bacteroidota bacterium]
MSFNIYKNPVFSFLGGLILGGIVLAIPFVFFFFLIFDLVGQTIEQEEAHNVTLLMIAVIMAVLAFFAGRYLFRKGRKFMALGAGGAPLAVLVYAVVYFSGEWVVRRPFQREVWARASQKPLGMAARLEEDNRLIGLSKDEVERMLGKAITNYYGEPSNDNLWAYAVEKDWTLFVLFEKGKVVSVELRLPGLGV